MIEGRVFALVVLLAFWGAMLARMNAAQRGAPVKIRRIAGFDAIEECIGRATEMGRTVHFSPGRYGVTLEMIAGMAALGHTAKLAAEYGAEFVATTAKGDAYTVADAIVREAYAEAGKADAYKPERVRFLADDQFAYASGVIGIMNRENVVANIMIGQFAAESLILAEAGNIAGAIQIAGAASTGQLPFFVAACDYVIIGEEIFAGDARFTGNARQLGCLQGQDLAKAITIGLMLLGSIASLFSSDLLVNLMSK